MNRNQNSRFALNPTNIDMPRSRFSRNQSHKTTFNIGDIIPFYVEEVLPGDTDKIRTSKVVRMDAMVAPIMDNVYLDTYYFFVPNRLVWNHWKQFMGENTESAWIPETEYTVPRISAPHNPNTNAQPYEKGWQVGTIADYMGVPVGVNRLEVNALPFRAYALICNEWFRDENLSDPLNIPKGDATQTGSNGDNYINDVANGGKPFKASKYFDYFTGALPAPQKGPDVSIPISPLPVFGNGYALGLMAGDGTQAKGLYTNNGSLIGKGTALSALAGDELGSNPPGAYSSAWSNGSVGVLSKSEIDHKMHQGFDGWDYSYTGLETGNDTLFNINQLRQAFQIQKFYEKSARGGTRYIELIKSMFGVTSPDARMQRPEYLGGNRIPININQVIQTSQTSSTSPLGDVAAYSLTSDSHDDLTHSFTEHGWLIGLMVARYDHTYQQGLERMWSRKTRFDFYWPLFANLGEQAIMNKEIYAQGPDALNPTTTLPYDNEVFGYQEAWADYRYKPNRVSGDMRSISQVHLDYWHLADNYSQLPSLSDSWIREDKNNMDRCLAVSSKLSMQLLADIYVQNITTRAMPIYSIPGLIDHH